MYGNGVGVTFDPDSVRMFLQNLCYPAERILGLHLHTCRTAVEEPGFTQADDQAIRLQVKCNFIALDLPSQGVLQLPLNGRQVLLYRLVAAGRAVAGKRNLVRYLSRLVTVGLEDAELLERGFNRDRKTSGFSLVHLG